MAEDGKFQLKRNWKFFFLVRSFERQPSKLHFLRLQLEETNFFSGQELISSTLYARVFRTNVVSADFSSYVYIEKAAETTLVQKICM
jgi:hypothetical protein